MDLKYKIKYELFGFSGIQITTCLLALLKYSNQPLILHVDTFPDLLLMTTPIDINLGILRSIYSFRLEANALKATEK